MSDKSQLKRVEEVIRNDRFKAKDEFSKLLYLDLKKLLLEYFEFKDLEEPEIVKNGDHFTVSLKFNAIALKPFLTLPQ